MLKIPTISSKFEIRLLECASRPVMRRSTSRLQKNILERGQYKVLVAGMSEKSTMGKGQPWQREAALSSVQSHHSIRSPQLIERQVEQSRYILIT